MSAAPFKVAVLDESGVLVDLVTLASEAELAEQHLDLRPHGGDCDLPFGQYRWDGKTFLPLAAGARPMPGTTISLERAFDRLLSLCEKKGIALDDLLVAWRAAYRSSLDNAGAKK